MWGWLNICPFYVDDYVNIRFLLSWWDFITKQLFLWALSIYKSFISFKKWELNTFILLDTSSEIITFLRVMVIWRNTYVKDVYTGTATIRGIKGNFIEAASIRNIGTKDICFDSSYIETDTCSRDIWIKDIGTINIKDT